MARHTHTVHQSSHQVWPEQGLSVGRKKKKFTFSKNLNYNLLLHGFGNCFVFVVIVMMVGDVCIELSPPLLPVYDHLE